MKPVVEYLPSMRTALQAIEDGESVFLYAPRHHGKRRFLTTVGAACQNGQTACAKVSSNNSGAPIDFQRLWSDTARQIGADPGITVADVEDYKEVLQDFLKTNNRRTVVLLTGAQRNNEKNHLDLILAFHYLLRYVPDRLTVLATDDYSVHTYYETLPVKSDLSLFDQVLHCLPLDRAEVLDLILEVLRDRGRRISRETASELAERTVASTGGHAGLVQAVVAELASKGRRTREGYWGAQGPNALIASPILVALGEALKEDPHALCDTALDFREAKRPGRNPRVDVLNQLGILLRQKSSVWWMRLCPGVITRMVEEIGGEASRGESQRVGTVLSVQVPRMYLRGNLDFDDRSFVALHLSDLHVSDHYAFMLPTARSLQNEHALSLVDLLVDDLQTLGLLRLEDGEVIESRVDLLIVSGDFVGKGQDNHDFHRARELIGELLRKTLLGPDRIAIVAGNHDMEWGPGGRAQLDHGDVSSGNYRAFAHLLRKRECQRVDLISLFTREGLRKLRVLELDSNAVESEQASGIGFVAADELNQAHELITRDDETNRRTGVQDVITWVVVHHHLFPATSAKEREAGIKRVSVLANADELMYYANRWKADLILHGHEHQPCVSVACRWPVDSPFELAHPLKVVGAGSIGARSEHLSPIKKNQYYVIYRRPDDVVIRSRCLGDKGLRFGAHGDLFLSC